MSELATGEAAQQRDRIEYRRAMVRALSSDANNIRAWQKHDAWTGPHVAYHTEGTIPERRETKTVLMLKELMVIDTNSDLLYRISKPKQKSQEVEYQRRHTEVIPRQCNLRRPYVSGQKTCSGQVFIKTW